MLFRRPFNEERRVDGWIGGGLEHEIDYRQDKNVRISNQKVTILMP
jgi:hypothetical protein